jgi:filamentous hemagglutinin
VVALGTGRLVPGGGASVVESEFSLVARVSELRSSIPANSRGRITMSVGVADDANGIRRILIGTSEPNGYLRPGVTLNRRETLAPGLGHAEVDIVTFAQQNNLRLIEVGATRPVCPSCVPIVKGAGAKIVTPIKGR